MTDPKLDDLINQAVILKVREWRKRIAQIRLIEERRVQFYELYRQPQVDDFTKAYEDAAKHLLLVFDALTKAWDKKFIRFSGEPCLITGDVLTVGRWADDSVEELIGGDADLGYETFPSGIRIYVRNLPHIDPPAGTGDLENITAFQLFFEKMVAENRLKANDLIAVTLLGMGFFRIPYKESEVEEI